MINRQISADIGVSCQSAADCAISMRLLPKALMVSGSAFNTTCVVIDTPEGPISHQCRSPYTTTWVMLETPTGDIVETTLEYLLDQPTHYPVDPELQGLSGDYRAFVQAQQGGITAARAYARSHGENTGDPELTELQRGIRLRAIRYAASQVPIAPRRGFRKASASPTAAG